MRAFLAAVFMLLGATAAFAQARMDQTGSWSTITSVAGTDTFPDCQSCSSSVAPGLATAAQLGTYLGSLSQTLTNKTLSCASNTCTNVPTSALTGALAAAQFPALTGDITTTAGSLATTLATVNSSPGSTTCSSITTNGKGLVTANSTPASCGPVATVSTLGSSSPDGISIGVTSGVYSTLPPQYKAIAASCTVNLTCVSTNDTPNVLYATAAGVTFTLPAPAAVGSGGFTFSAPFGISYTLSVGGGALFVGCGPNAASVVLAGPTQVLTNGTNYNCYGDSGGALATVTVSNSASISFTSIPALQNIHLDCNLQPVNNGVGLLLRLNGDTGVHYSLTGVYTLGGSATIHAFAPANSTSIQLDDGTVIQESSTISFESVHLNLNPAGSAAGAVNQSVSGEVNWADSAATAIAHGTILGTNNANVGAITSMSLFYTAGNISAGTCTLSYGPQR